MQDPAKQKNSVLAWARNFFPHPAPAFLSFKIKTIQQTSEELTHGVSKKKRIKDGAQSRASDLF